jgi:hypothetical protein
VAVADDGMITSRVHSFQFAQRKYSVIAWEKNKTISGKFELINPV